jgi:BrxA
MAGRTIDIKHMKERLACAPYTSKIIKAGALLADTKTLLSHWDVGMSVQENMYRLRRKNVFGKASRSRVEDMLAIFRQRYLTETPVTKALVMLVQHRFPAASLDRILYFHAARVDRLLC